MIKRYVQYVALAGLIFVKQLCFAHMPAVHKAISIEAVTLSLALSPGYISFLNAAGENAINSFSDGHTNRSADAWIGFGAAREDLVNIDAGGIRPYNHFYDPFTKLGLTDIPLGYNSSTQLGLNSFLWASTFDALAPNTTIGSIFFPG